MSIAHHANEQQASHDHQLCPLRQLVKPAQPGNAANRLLLLLRVAAVTAAAAAARCLHRRQGPPPPLLLVMVLLLLRLVKLMLPLPDQR